MPQKIRPRCSELIAVFISSNVKLTHFVQQRRAFKAKQLSGATLSSDSASRCLQCMNDRISFAVPETQNRLNAHTGRTQLDDGRALGRRAIACNGRGEFRCCWQSWQRIVCNLQEKKGTCGFDPTTRSNAVFWMAARFMIFLPQTL